MARCSNGIGLWGLLLGVFVWIAPVSGWTGAPKRAPDEVKLREAERLKSDYIRFNEQGNYREAATLAEQACAILGEERGDESVEIAGCLNDLAAFYSDQGSYERAKSLYERALAIRERALGPEHLDVAQSLNGLGELYNSQAAYARAKPFLERALAIREQTLGPDHADFATSLNNLAFLYDSMAAYENAELLYTRALNIREKALGPNHPVVAQSLNNLAALYHKQGFYRGMEPLLQRAISVREKALGPDHPDVVTVLNNLAMLYHEQGAYEKAEPLYERALAISERAIHTDPTVIATGLNNLAGLYLLQGAYGKAEPLLERAFIIIHEALGLDHPLAAMSLNNLAGLRRAQGAYHEAEQLYGQALAIHEKRLGSDHVLVAWPLGNLATLYQYQGAYDKARPLYERALATMERSLDPSHPAVATCLMNLAWIYHEQGASDKAEMLLERALTASETALGPEHPSVALILHSWATLLDDRHSRSAALDIRRRALDIEEINLARSLAVTEEGRRLAYMFSLSGSLHYTLSLHLRVTRGRGATGEFALTSLLRRKGRAQDIVAQSNAVLRRSLPEGDRHLHDDLSDVVSRIAVLSSRGTGPLPVKAYAQQLDELGKERDRLWRELAKHSSLVEALHHPITIEDVRSGLPAGSALIELVQYVPRHDDTGTLVREHEPRLPPRYAAYLVFPDRFDWVDLGPAAPIDEHVEAFREAMQTRQAIPTDLYDAIMRPIVEKLGSAHHLIIAPAGNLSLVPFGAFYDGKRYLVDQYDLRYVTTGRDLLFSPASPPVTTPVTVVANPAGANLPDAELEADFLASLFPHTRVLRGDQATETNVRAIERPLVLHMATHGFFGEALNERDNPLFRSGLYLADVDQVEVDRERDDGQLTAYEVSGMDLRGTQLVVLSACETGLGATDVKKTDVGNVDMNEGVFGLRRAFAMAGARTTVMSLWEVSGVTAQKTMEAYYRKLAEGMGRGEAMQAVQLEMLRSEEHAHPKDWAAFIVSGDDTPMVFPEGEEPRKAEDEPQGPPPVQRRVGCAMAAPVPDRDPSVPALLLGLLGLGALRRRRP